PGHHRVGVSTRTAALAAGLLAVAVALPSLRNGFVSDDRWIIVERPLLVQPPSVTAVLTEPYWPAGFGGVTWRPAVLASFALDYRLGGSAHWFHAVNVLWTGLAAALLTLLACRRRAPGTRRRTAHRCVLHPPRGVHQGKLRVRRSRPGAGAPRGVAARVGDDPDLAAVVAAAAVPGPLVRGLLARRAGGLDRVHLRARARPCRLDCRRLGGVALADAGAGGRPGARVAHRDRVTGGERPDPDRGAGRRAHAVPTVVGRVLRARGGGDGAAVGAARTRGAARRRPRGRGRPPHCPAPGLARRRGAVPSADPRGAPFPPSA